MAHYQVILAYDGTEFRGYQRQAAGRQGRTVQGVIEAALRQLGWTGGSILAAGRTDRGVHAAGQVIGFELDWQHSPQALQAALNAQLPADIVLRSVRLASGDFHPRYSALARSYRYHIYCQAVRDPLRDRYAWRVWPAVELERMQTAARSLCGTHDFAPFGTPPRVGGSTIRTVTQSIWTASPEGFQYDVTADAFLYRMVRRMVAALVEIGQGRLPPDWIEKLLETGASTPIQGLAPPNGLVLLEVSYPTSEVGAGDQQAG